MRVITHFSQFLHRTDFSSDVGVSRRRAFCFRAYVLLSSLLVALLGLYALGLPPLKPRNGWHFLLDQKVPKNSSQTKCFLCRTGPCAAKPVKPRAAPILPRFARTGPRFSKPSNALPAAQATTVLPSFARKPSSDGLC